MTFGEWLPIWLDLVKPTVKQKTHEGYQLIVKKHLLPRFGNKKIRSLTLVEAQGFINELAEKYSPETVMGIRRVFNNSLNYAIRQGAIVGANVVSMTKPPRVPKTELENVLSEKQLRRLLDTAQTDDFLYEDVKQIQKFDDGERYLHRCYYALIYLAATTGMRKGEVFGLQRKNLNLEKKYLRVVTTVTSTKKGMILSDPKTSTSARKISLTDNTVSVLKEWLNFQAQYAEKWRGIYNNKYGMVFTDSRGGFVSQNFNSRYWKRLIAAAHMPKGFTFHGLRHTIATILIQKGVPIMEVSRRLGHASADITMKIYSHSLSEMEGEATGKLNSLNF